MIWRSLETPKYFLLTPEANCGGDRQDSYKDVLLGRKMSFLWVHSFVCVWRWQFFSLGNNSYLVVKCHCKNTFECVVNHISVYLFFCCVHENITLSMWWKLRENEPFHLLLWVITFFISLSCVICKRIFPLVSWLNKCLFFFPEAVERRIGVEKWQNKQALKVNYSTG